MTPAYNGEQITSTQALSDAFELGLVEEPKPAGTFIAAPVVLLETMLEVDTGKTVGPETVFGHGVKVGLFRLGGMYKEQPGGGALPTRQVSYLHPATGGAPGGVVYDPVHPVFQTVTEIQPSDTATYSALNVVVNVDLA